MQTVFFIDDEIALCESFEDLFDLEGFELHTYNDPKKAIEDCDRLNPHHIFADYRMPKINGLELIKTIGKGRNCYLISGELDLLIEEPLIRRIIPKPFKFSQIYTLLTS